MAAKKSDVVEGYPVLWVWLFSLGLVVAFFYYLSNVMAPFLSAALLVYMMNPAVNRLVRYRLPRLLAVLLVFIVIILVLLLLLLFLVPLFLQQTHLLMKLLPQMMMVLQERLLPWIQSLQGGPIETSHASVLVTLKNTLATHWQGASDIATIILQTIATSSMALLHLLTNILLVALVTFYGLLDWDLVLNAAQTLLPPRIAPTLLRLCNEANEMIGAFFRGQLWIMVLLGLGYGIGLGLMGLNVGLLIGLIAGLLSVVPYLGFISGAFIAIVVSLFQFHGFAYVYPITGLFVVGHLLESFWLTPWLVGDKIGLHPIAVIFAIVVSGECFGFMGVLLALPLAAVLKVLLRYFYQRYLRSPFYLLG
jgi:predicted PurR-regulated permease PerM